MIHSDEEIVREIARAIARDFVARQYPSLRKDLIEINVDMVASVGHGNVHPERFAKIALETIRSLQSSPAEKIQA